MAASIEEVKAKYTEDLMSRPGVVSVGIGRDDDGQAVILVGIDPAHAGSDANIPPELEGYGVRVRPTGPVRAQ